jgi:hypothetical protein
VEGPDRNTVFEEVRRFGEAFVLEGECGPDDCEAILFHHFHDLLMEPFAPLSVVYFPFFLLA